MTSLGPIVRCSGGLTIVRGAAPLPPGPALRVGEIAPVLPPATAAMEARRSDNVVWRRHWSETNRLVVEFVDLAFVEVDGPGGVVRFDRRLAPDMEEHLLFDHVLPLLLARHGALVLHGGVISRNGRAAVLIGPSGAGKSTLTAFAWQHGWTVGGDDGAVLSPGDPPAVEPTYATIRLSPASADLLGIERATTSAVAGKMRIHADPARAFSQQPVDLRMVAVVQPAPVDAGASFERLDLIEAHARLFGSTFHTDFSAARLLPGVMEGLASIVESATVGRLAVPRTLDGLAAAEALLREALKGDDGHDAEARPGLPTGWQWGDGVL